MFGLMKKQKSPMTQDQLDAVIQVLGTVGFEERWGFSDHAVNPDNYHSNVFEWTDRVTGLRVVFCTDYNSNKVNRIVVSRHDHPIATQAEVDVANIDLADLIRTW